ncbi:MAG: GWxTD domain-containing protein [Bacteroidia bacterium]|nr:GWxTD domain-containing protein [Bacteroidia bacterium]MDW8235535.1 GWxTD domain-containing protein [Bacteroidia bacterium]
MRSALWIGLLWAQPLFYVEPVRFYTPEGEPYLELFLGLDATSVRFVPEGNAYKGETEFSLLLKNAKNEPVYADKFRFSLPVLSDTNAPERQRIYVDARRLRLPSGIYTLEIEAQDPHQLPRPQQVKAITQFEVPAPRKSFAYSDLIYARTLTQTKSGLYQRHGMSLELWVSNGFLIDPDTLWVYGELYRIDSLTDQPYYLRLRLLDAQRALPLENYTFTQRPRRPSGFEAFAFRIPLRYLPSGIYLAQIELCRNDGEILYTWYRRFTLFSTREPIVEANEAEYDANYGFPENKLDELLGGMIYLATPVEKSFMQTFQSLSDKKKFFVAFWKKREGQPNAITFKEYLKRFEYAQQHFKSTMRPGWRTDRGRVMIQYGAPNDIQYFYNEPDKYPYQIWTYNQIGSQGQVIFVFYDPDLITGEYPLLHSNKIGEIQNRNWRAFLLRARAAATGETEQYQRFGSGGAFIFRDDQTIGFTRDDR